MSRNARRVVEDLERHKRCFDFTEGRLAEDAAEVTAVGIFEFMEFESDWDHVRWDELSEAYAKAKARKYPGRKMAERELRMKDPEQLKGTLQIATDTLTQTYGKDDLERDEAGWFQEGNDRQPARGFYALNDLCVHHLDNLFDARFRSQV